MDNLKIVNQVMTDLEKRNWDNVESKLTDDFTFSGAVPQPIDKKQWMSVQKAIQTGIPDLKFNLQQVVAKGDNKVSAKVKLSGTHTADMPGPIPGLKPISVTGKKVTLPLEEIEITLRGEKISNFYVKPVVNGGVQGLVKQLEGVEATQHA